MQVSLLCSLLRLICIASRQRTRVQMGAANLLLFLLYQRDPSRLNTDRVPFIEALHPIAFTLIFAFVFTGLRLRKDRDGARRKAAAQVRWSSGTVR